jgi:cytochrome b involved in lipid metabolism
MLYIKNKDMNKKQELNKTLQEALKNNVEVLVLINGEYYDISEEV